MAAAGKRFATLFRGALLRTRYGGIRNSGAYFLARFSALRYAARPFVRWQRSSARVDLPSGSLFENVKVETATGHLQQNSYASGLALPASLVDEIVAFANSAVCTTCLSYGSDKSVSYLKQDWKEAERESGHSIALGRIPGVGRCQAVRRIMQDRVLYEIGQRYFGYAPKYFEPHLYWSFVNDLSDEDRVRRGQNVRFHYDLHHGHVNYLFFHFYLTDVDSHSGPLVVARGSHHRKPLKYLWSSANQAESSVVTQYGGENIVELTGPAGSGFVMDGYCMHRAKPPASNERLALQVRVA